MYLIKKKHKGIDLSSIDFPSLRGVEILDFDDGEAVEDEDAEVESTNFADLSVLLEDPNIDETQVLSRTHKRLLHIPLIHLLRILKSQLLTLFPRLSQLPFNQMM